MLKFYPFQGDLMGLPVTENHLVFRWCGEGKVLFSCCKHGNALSAHFASDKKGLRYLKQAICEFCEFVFYLFGWCTMVIAATDKKSIIRLIEKCNFKIIEPNFYARLR